MKLLLLIITISMTVTGCALFAPKNEITTPNRTNNAIKTSATPLVLKPVAIADEVEPTLHRDINKDGVVDSVFIAEDGGSAYGGNYLTILDGKTKKHHSADNADFYGAAISVCAIDIKDAAFAKAAQELLLPKDVRSSLDPLGSWLVSANYNKRILNNNPYFDMIAKPKLVWINDKTISSADYCVNITPEKASEYLKHRSRHQDEDFATAGVIVSKTPCSTWFVYRGYRFRTEPLKEVGRSGEAIIYANNQCIGVEQNGQFAWLFVNEGCLFGRTGEGIASIDVQDGLLLLELIASKTVIVDIKTGKVASIKPYCKEYPCDDEGNIKSTVINAFKTL